MKYQYILFDLDGTLTDPKMGITKSVAYALKKMKDWTVDINDLTKFIGPPLNESFTDFYGFTLTESNRAIEFFREYFKAYGIYENEIYPGIKDLLKSLKDSGKVLAVATSKPTVFAEKIIEYFELEEYFECVVGSNLDGTRTKKKDVIETVLDILEIDSKEAIMVGDREHDILGAKAMCMSSIGVVYGYSIENELSDAGAEYIVDSVFELKNLLL